MDFKSQVEVLRAGQKPEFPAEANTLDFARSLDAQDEIRHLRNQFILPTRASLKKKTLNGIIPEPSKNVNGVSREDDDNAAAIYFCGNSLGLQPKLVRPYLHKQLETWASIGVAGHFTNLENSPFPNWQDMSGACSAKFAPIVGALPDEIVVMNSLTANLHFMMASLYKPTATRYKVILEWKPFPSDWYAIQSQLALHNIEFEDGMVEIQPDNEDCYISTETVLRIIDAHANDAALLLLPGIQYYSGQLFDIATITAHARAKGLVVGWDLAHAVGNVPLRLHDWGVDFSCWCTYKYLNAGPGAIAAVFVHERHGAVTYPDGDTSRPPAFHPRLSGWYGGDKLFRFEMARLFRPTPGAAGFQCSNPSAIDLAALMAALDVFGMTSMEALRGKAMLLTAYAEVLLDRILDDGGRGKRNGKPAWRILTPRDPRERGTQLSLLLRDGLIDKVLPLFAERGIVCDKRKPDVIRVAPVPMYCTFEEVWRFMQTLKEAVES